MQKVLKIDTPFPNRYPSLTTSYKRGSYIVLSYYSIIFSFVSIPTILLQVILCMLSLFSHVRLFVTPWTLILCPQDSPGRNTGVGYHALLQGIFPAQGSSPGLVSAALASRFFTTSAAWEALWLLRKKYVYQCIPFCGCHDNTNLVA